MFVGSDGDRFLRARSIVINVYTVSKITHTFFDSFFPFFVSIFSCYLGRKRRWQSLHTRAGAVGCGRGYNTREPLSDLFLSNRKKKRETGQHNKVTTLFWTQKTSQWTSFFFPFKWSPCFPIVCQPAGHSEKIKNGHDLSIKKKYIYVFLIYFRYINSWARHMRVFIAGQITFQRRLSLPWHPPSSTHTIVWLIDDFSNRE